MKVKKKKRPEEVSRSPGLVTHGTQENSSSK
jgi:hypothetical protein